MFIRDKYFGENLSNGSTNSTTFFHDLLMGTTQYTFPLLR